MGYGRKNKKNYPPPSSALRSSAKCLQRMAPVRAAPFSLPPASRGMASIKASFEYITISDLRKKNHHRPGFQVQARGSREPPAPGSSGPALQERGGGRRTARGGGEIRIAPVRPAMPHAHR